MTRVSLVVAMLICSSLAQRSPYARRPVGYPELEVPTTTTAAPSLAPDLNTQDFGNRLSSSGGVTTARFTAPAAQAPPTIPRPTTTTIALPLEAMGDRALVEKLLKLPLDDQPFWLLNWQFLEQQRNEPKYYDSRPSFFIDRSSWNPRQ